MATAAVSTSKLLSKIKTEAKGAWDQARSVTPKAKGQQLPDKLIKAKARVTATKFAETEDKGKGTAPYFMIKFVVLEPGSAAGIQAFKMYILRAREGKFPKSVGQILEDLANDLQLLGVVTDGSSIDDLPKLVEQLGKDKPYFEFNTWQPPERDDGTDSNVLVFIQGLCPENYTPPAGIEVVEDEPAPEAEPQQATPKGPKSLGKGPAKGPVKAAPEPEPEPEPEGDPAPEASSEAPDIAVNDEFYFRFNSANRYHSRVLEYDKTAGTVRVEIVEDGDKKGQKFSKQPISKLEDEAGNHY